MILIVFRWLYIIAVILGCLALAAIVIFLLVPRAVYLSSSRPPIEIINVFSHDDEHISFHFFVSYCIYMTF